jgi:membrane protein
MIDLPPRNRHDPDVARRDMGRVAQDNTAASSRSAERNLLGRIESAFWGPQAQDLPPWKLRALRIGRTALVLGQDLARGQLTLRAMSLVYTTLLSLVPLLALSFSVV